MEFTCRTCGQRHDTGEISFGADAPAQWMLISDEEREKSELGGDQCVIEADGQRHYFVRACLEVPIQGAQQAFTWGVWVSLSEKSFREMSDHWKDPSRTSLGPYFGWLCTRLPEYPDTVFLKTMVHQRPVGLRPLVELDETDHPLSIDQRRDIEPARMQDIIRKVLHSE
ncbi:MAG: DUF2199 domain-containing protein [Planctomycetes bacterium]|nr:DUF2199 domain-containing protein [Planctomycetota bacterium]